MKKLVFNGLLASSLLCVGSAQAVLIDDFNVDQIIFITDAAPTTVNDTVSGSTASVIGGERELEVDKIVGNAGIVDSSAAQAVGGLLGMSNGPATNSTVTILWDGAGSAGLGGVDLTEGGTATGFFLSLPNPIDNDLDINFILNGSSSFSQTFANGSQGDDFFIPFASFSNPGAAGSADSISLVISNGVAWDAQIDFIETRPRTPVPVPEPTSLLLFSIGLAGLGTLSMRKKR